MSGAQDMEKIGRWFRLQNYRAFHLKNRPLSLMRIQPDFECLESAILRHSKF